MKLQIVIVLMCCVAFSCAAPSSNTLADLEAVATVEDSESLKPLNRKARLIGLGGLGGVGGVGIVGGIGIVGGGVKGGGFGLGGPGLLL